MAHPHTAPHKHPHCGGSHSDVCASVLPPTAGCACTCGPGCACVAGECGCATGACACDPATCAKTSVSTTYLTTANLKVMLAGTVGALVGIVIGKKLL